jgi:hypothetical protein
MREGEKDLSVFIDFLSQEIAFTPNSAKSEGKTYHQNEGVCFANWKVGNTWSLLRLRALFRGLFSLVTFDEIFSLM